jgi:hypothetical protein
MFGGELLVLADGIDGLASLFNKRPRALQREMLRLIEPLDAIGPAAAGRVTEEVRAKLADLPGAAARRRRALTVLLLNIGVLARRAGDDHPHQGQGFT